VRRAFFVKAEGEILLEGKWSGEGRVFGVARASLSRQESRKVLLYDFLSIQDRKLLLLVEYCRNDSFFIEKKNMI
jgi:hypothetical protein